MIIPKRPLDIQKRTLAGTPQARFLQFGNEHIPENNLCMSVLEPSLAPVKSEKIQQVLGNILDCCDLSKFFFKDVIDFLDILQHVKTC